MLRIFALIALLVFSVGANDKVDHEGHNPGKFTMDYEAAKKYAAEKGLPIFIDFTGSDWCGWCKLMDKNVFSQQDWTNFAKDNLVLVYIDFPKDKSLVPEKYVARNKEMSKKFGVQGYPTYFIIDPVSEDILGKLGAGKDKTPASFIAEVENYLSMTPGNVAKVAKTMGDKGAEYEANYKKIQENSKQLAEAKKALEVKAKAIAKENAELKEKMADARVLSRLKPEQVEEFQKLKSELKSAEEALKTFMESEPEQTQENLTKYKELMAKVAEAKAKIAAL